MTTAFAEQGTITVIRIQGEIDPSLMEALTLELTGLALERRTRVILDLRRVTHMALGSIRELVEKVRRFRGLGGDIKLAGPIPYVINLLKLVGATSDLDIAPDEEVAAARFGS